MREDSDVLQESDRKRLQAALTFTRVAIQRHKTDSTKERNKVLYDCLPENGAVMPNGQIETYASATFCRIQIIRLRKAIRVHMIDKNDSRLYKLVEESHTSQIKFPETLT